MAASTASSSDELERPRSGSSVRRGEIWQGAGASVGASGRRNRGGGGALAILSPCGTGEGVRWRPCPVAARNRGTGRGCGVGRWAGWADQAGGGPGRQGLQPG